MATKASRIALAGSNISSTGEVDADLLDNIDSAAFLSLDSNGRLGIGTASPNKELHLLSSTINKPMIKIESTGTNSYPGFQIVNDSQTWEVSTHGGHSDALTFYNGSTHTFALATAGNVGIGTTGPRAQFHVEPPGASNGFATSGKNISLTTSFQTGAQLEVTLGDHQACYVKVFISGDWSGHSAVAFLGEYFIQNGANAYAEPGMIIREVDNTAGPTGDHISSQIYDGGNYDSFQIQFKLNAFSGGVLTCNGNLSYQVMGQFNAIT